jgi:dipeptidyl aminopeptidase/acylaminoacyl peptidase
MRRSAFSRQSSISASPRHSREENEDVRLKLRIGLVALVVAVYAVSASAQDRRTPTIDDMLDMVQVSAPQLSPDGLHILYARSDLKPWKENKRASTIWIVGSDGSGPRQFLSSDRDRNPAWSPDGKLVAFLSTRDQGSGAGSGDRDAGPQIWLIRTDGGEAWKLSDHKGNIRSFEWSRDGSRIFFLSEDAKTEEEKTAEKEGDDAIFVDEGPNGQGRGRYGNLWHIAVETKVERQITNQKMIVSDFAPSHDGTKVAFTYRRQNWRNGQHEIEVAVADVETGVMRDLTKNQTPESGVGWSPDGSMVSFVASGDSTYDLTEGYLYLAPATGGKPRKIFGGTQSFRGGSYFWAPDGKSIYFSSTKNARGGLYQLDVASGKLRTIATGDYSIGLQSVSADFTRGAGVLSGPSAPGDVQVVDLAKGTMTKVTDVNPQLSGLELAQMRGVTWKSHDGLEIEGLLWLPASYKGETRLPLVLSIHGGPASVFTTSWRDKNHVLAGLGWAILEPNVRGSTSYGDALLQGNTADIGGGDYHDLMTGVDHLISLGIADPDRLAVRGWSYGGILGGWTITQTDRFKAASLGAMVADWPSEYAMGFNHDVRNWYIGGTPWENPEPWRRMSSYTHIARVTTPTILLHGEQDTTCTIGQSMMFYQGLKDRGVTVRFIRFPREGHGIREPRHIRIRDAEEIAWLMKHTLGIDWRAPERKDARPEPKKTTND